MSFRVMFGDDTQAASILVWALHDAGIYSWIEGEQRWTPGIGWHCKCFVEWYV